jgi:hypothetical protein
MVAALLQFNHRATTIAALPTGLFRCFEKTIRLLIAWTLFLPVPFPTTQDTNLRFTTAALSILPTFPIIMVVSRFDPFPAPPRWAVDAVLGGVLLELSIPELLKRNVEQLVDVLQRDAICSAALGRHMLGVSDGELKDPTQAGVAHAMAAFELR